MAVRGNRPSRKSLIWLAVAGLLAPAGTLGCGSSSDAPAEVAQEAPEKAAVPPPAAPAETVRNKPADHDRLHQSFLQATRKDPPPDQRPPDRTVTGKSVGKVYGEVVRLWDTVRFVAADGSRIGYSATLETDLGEIEIALLPEHAPNHVRNFIALARAGYYDGLVFDRIYAVEGQTPDGEKTRYEEIEAGCPLGTGEPEHNSVGYWLKPESSLDTTHEVGTVGACHGLEQDTAACKFYITLCKAPHLDGMYTVFGKVTRGLDVARKIHLAPVIIDDSDPNVSHRPEKPVVIRKVTIHARQGDKQKETIGRR